MFRGAEDEKKRREYKDGGTHRDVELDDEVDKFEQTLLTRGTKEVFKQMSQEQRGGMSDCRVSTET